jgi:hypothetical protein
VGGGTVAVNLKVYGNGSIAGGETAVTTYQVTEEATPIEVSDSSGAIGSLRVSATETQAPTGSVLLLDDIVDLEDGAYGTTQAIVRGLSITNGQLSIEAENRLSLLNVERQALPYTGTLDGLIYYYLSLCDLNTKIIIDPIATLTPVAVGGWFGDVWFYLKQLCIANNLEITFVSDNIVFRPLRQRTAATYRDSSVTQTINTDNTARSVEIYQYKNVYKSNGFAFPTTKPSIADPVWQVDAGETQVFDVPINASLSSVSQPVPYTYVQNDYTGFSAYTVTDKDKNIVDPAVWLAGGGSVTVKLNQDTTSLTITVKGSSDVAKQPFRIAMPIGSGEDTDVYSSIRIVGQGVFYEKVLHTFPCVFDSDRTTRLVGATVDNQFLVTDAQVLDAGVRCAAAWSGPAHSIKVSTLGINNLGVSGEQDYYSFGDWDATKPNGYLFSSWDLEWPTQTFGDFDAITATKEVQNFETQAFGNVAGARRYYRFNWFRITQADYSAENNDYTAEEDTTFGDFDTTWGDAANFASFDTIWDGKQYKDFSPIPLWKGETRFDYAGQ